MTLEAVKQSIDKTEAPEQNPISSPPKDQSAADALTIYLKQISQYPDIPAKEENKIGIKLRKTRAKVFKEIFKYPFILDLLGKLNNSSNHGINPISTEASARFMIIKHYYSKKNCKTTSKKYDKARKEAQEFLINSTVLFLPEGTIKESALNLVKIEVRETYASLNSGLKELQNLGIRNNTKNKNFLKKIDALASLDSLTEDTLNSFFPAIRKKQKGGALKFHPKS